MANNKVTEFYDDAGASRRIISKLHDIHGMSLHRIAEESAISRWQAQAIHAGTQKKVAPPVARRIARVVPLSDIGAMGARIDATATRRRIDALTYEGWSITWQAEQAKLALRTLTFIVARKHTLVHASTRDAIRDLYDQCEEMQSQETRRVQKIIRNAVLKRNGAARHCWDDDTIEDPHAIAEWTGECGTPLGYRIHVREGQKFWKPSENVWRFGCQPCRTANHLYVKNSSISS